jgi:hypothetical protein
MRFFAPAASLCLFLSLTLLVGAGCGQGTASFPQETILSTGQQYAAAVITADFDGDGLPDIAAASLQDSEISWYRNNGDGTFSAPILVSLAARGPASLAAADIDGDGRVDLVSASELDNKIAWYRNTGGTLGAVFGSSGSNQKIISTNATHAFSVAVADLDGDGLPDVISASLYGSKIAWYRNLGGGNFGWNAAAPAANQKVISTASIAPSCVVAGDLDGDGVTDLAVTSINDDTLAWLKGSVAANGTVTFTRYVISTTQLRAQSVSIADVNGDHHPDLLCAAPYGNKVTYFRNLTQGPNAAAPYFAAEQVVTDEALGAFGVTAADLDRDGNPDIVSASLLDNKIAWHRSSGPDATGAVTFGPEQLISTNAQEAVAVSTGDYDGDGAPDVASASQRDGKIAVYFNEGNFPMSPAPTLISPAKGTITTSPIVVAYTLPVAALDGSLKLTFTSGSTVRELVLTPAFGTAGAHNFSFNPADPAASPAVQSATGSIPDGTYSVALSYADTQGGLPTASLAATGVIIDAAAPYLPGGATTIVAAQGGLVPGATEPGSNVPGDALFRTFGVPALNGAGQLAVTATYSSSEGMNQVILGPKLDAEFQVLVSGGDQVPDATGAFLNGIEFLNFKDVLLNGAGSIAFLGTVRSAGPTAAAVTVHNDTGIWTNAGNGQLHLVAREGDPAPNFAATFKAFTSVALSSLFVPGNAGSTPPLPTDQGARVDLAFVAQLRGTGIATTNDDSLWIYESGLSTSPTLKLVLREGQWLSLRGATPRRVKAFAALVAPGGAAGHGRGSVPSGVLARIVFFDGTLALVRCAGDGTVQDVALSEDAVVGTGAKLTSFALPAQNTAGDTAFVGTLKGLTPNSAVIFTPTDGDRLLVARKGVGAAGLNGTVFASFRTSVPNQEKDLAVVANLAGRGVVVGNNESLWKMHPTAPGEQTIAPVLIAREGARPPGLAAGAQWARFGSVAMPDGVRGPIFIANLVVPAAGRPNPAHITARNDTGLWAVDSAGVLRLILREGDPFPGTQKSIRAFTLLSVVGGSPAQTRSFNASSELTYRATLIDGTQAIAKVRVP